MKASTRALTFLSASIAAAAMSAFGADSAPAPVRSGLEPALKQLNDLIPGTGLEARLFALEPMVVNPTDMDVDARGRVWITEGANYRSTFQKWGVLRPEGDRIQILEDTDGDGLADRAKTFYQDPSINAALGICVLGNRVIVTASPYIFVLTDTNGDDVADRRELMFTTELRQADHDHAGHAFVFGPDGRLYFNFGNAGGALRRPSAALKSIPLHGKLPAEELAKGEIVKDIDGFEITDKGKPYRQGMAFRCEMDGSRVEVLGHNFRNNYEVAVDSFGTVWQPDNDDDGNKGVRVNYVMEYGNYGYVDEKTGANWQQKRTGWETEIPLRHWHLNDPGVVPNFIQTGAGSPTGVCIYEGHLLPSIFRNQVIHCDAGPRVVRAYPATRDGAGYRGVMEDILTSRDSWYRPSDVCVAPDGSLFIADWNDAGVGGHYMADQKLEAMTGRVYRVAPAGNRSSVPKVDVSTASGAIAALQSPNHSVRYLAWTALHGMGLKAEKELLKLWGSENPRFRARALHLLGRLPGKGAAHLQAGLRAEDPDLRITALRAVRATQGDVIGAVRTLVKDSSPQVRRDAAIALRRLDSKDAVQLWAQLAQQHDGKDRWYLEALGIGAERKWDACLTAYLEAQPDAIKTPAGRDIVWRSRARATPGLLVKILNSPSTTPAEQPRYLRSLDFVSGPEKDAALLELLNVPAKN